MEDKKEQVILYCVNSDEFKKKKPSFIKRVFKWIGLIFGAIIAVFMYLGKSESKIDKEIKSKKEKDAELKKKANELQEDIKILKKMEERFNDVIVAKREDFDNFVSNTQEEAKTFEEEKKEIQERADDTQYNADWVKERFGGEVSINE